MLNKKKYSEIWNHFNATSEKKAKCKYCDSQISIAGGPCGNLSRHITRKHPTVKITLERQAALPLVVLEHNELSISAQDTESHTQPPISQFLKRPPPIRKVTEIDKQVLKMVAKGHHALRIVEEPEFKKLISLVSNCPGYMLPSRKSLTYNLLPGAYTELVNEIKSEIQKASAICLTTDAWTSQTNQSYMAVTAHFIDEETKLQSKLLCCEEFSEKHSAANLTLFLKKVKF